MLAMRSEDQSVVEDHGLYASTCGYCKSNAQTSVAYGLLAHSLSVYDYQDLLDRGWRRSGKFLYRPEMQRTCCPAYTIRLRAHSFVKSKEQARVLHKMQRFLDGEYIGLGSEKHMEIETMGSYSSGVGSKEDPGVACKAKRKEFEDKVDHTARDLLDAVKKVIVLCIKGGEVPDIPFSRIIVQSVNQNLRKRLRDTNGEVRYTCNVAFLCAAAVLKHTNAEHSGGWNNKVLKSNSQEALTASMAESICRKLQILGGLPHGFKVEACKGHLNFIILNAEGKPCATKDANEGKPELVSSSEDGHNKEKCVLEVDMQRSISNQEEHKQKSTSQQRLSREHGHSKGKRVLEVRMRRSAFEPEEFELYRKYQIAVHHDRPEDVKESSYIRFLVDSPLTYVPPSQRGTPICGFGSFHQQYLINGRLVAVGVVDILPCCLSSKYLFWDPELAFLSLGKYSAVCEIQWVQEANKSSPSLEFYYLGYYIHSCPKMQYKAAYCPSELLCPVKLKWVPIDAVLPLLDEQPYACLSDFLENSSKSCPGGVMKEERIKNSMGDDEVDDARDGSVIEDDNQQLVRISDDKVASSSKESEDVSNILLKLGNHFLRFEHLQAQMVLPKKFMDRLVRNLRRYSQVVGSTLAAKMAYVLG